MQRLEKKTARYGATEVLCKLFQTRRSVKVLFEQSATEANLGAADRRLMMQLVYGVLRHRQYLDRILEILSKTPLRKIEPIVHQAIVVGLYQLFFLERIPASAAVNEAVNICRQAGLPKRLQGFVNGILRQSVRKKESLEKQAEHDKSGNPILNHPAWLVERWQDQFGQEKTAQICASNNLEPLLVLRVNNLLQTRDNFLNLLESQGITAVKGCYAPDAVILSNFKGPITAIPGYDRGAFQVQDEAAQLVTMLLGPLRRGGVYLDGCAGVGSKSAHLVQLGADYDILVHAVEPDPYRHNLFQQNLARLFPDRKTLLHRGTLQQFSLQELPPFHGIIIDAPCSGTGVTGRHPDIRWNRRPEDILTYQKEQLSILHHSATLLVPGGVLVYASCSLEPEENFEVIRFFLQNHPEYSLTSCRNQLPEAAHAFITEKCFAPMPTKKIDGFFAARLVRSE